MDELRRRRILIADDHPLFRFGLATALSQNGFEVVAEVSNGEDAVRAARVHAGELDIALLDVRMPGLDGLTAARRIRSDAPRVRIAFLSTFDAPAVRSAAIQAGAAAFIRKDEPPESICEICRRLVDEPTLVLLRLSEGSTPMLSRRELDTLRYMASGASNRSIAAALGIGVETVKDHCARLFAKFETTDRTSTVARAHELGFFLVDTSRRCPPD